MPEGVGRRGIAASGMPPSGSAPSATTMIGAYWSSKRRSMYSQTRSIENFSSGIRITLAPPASPA